MANKNEIPSVRKLAKAVGKSPPTVAKWVKDSRWPFARRGPWPSKLIPAMQRWADETLRPDLSDPEAALLAATDVGDSDEMREAKLDVLRERARKLKLENDLAQKELVRVDDVKQSWGKHIGQAKQMLLAIAPKVAPLVAHQGAPEIERAIDEAIRDAMEELSVTA